MFDKAFDPSDPDRSDISGADLTFLRWVLSDYCSDGMVGLASIQAGQASEVLMKEFLSGTRSKKALGNVLLSFDRGTWI